ncbi:hypothetical protein EDEG_01590 [Edhazardia aedis USNM 41457]|uniref:Uncharacterized protein n=1 Tax=Edhazardia aedis (strain USNM 41457) TaxID=1003232 RepID=J9DNK3_EDHAE|nr:hypothetical protein EDEG_01590 [Edhazardia aedis USNM 41457]|eukprot:EJW04110.1 hypothetical protein EDEG_01590 [Edhazardia aedis USNM 41457]
MEKFYEDWIKNLRKLVILYKNVKINILSNNFFEDTNHTLNMIYKYYEANKNSLEFKKALQNDEECLYVFLFFEAFRDEFIKFDSELKTAIYYEMQFIVESPYYEYFPLYCNDVNSEQRYKRIVDIVESEMKILYDDLKNTTTSNARILTQLLSTNLIMRDLISTFDAVSVNRNKERSSCAIM